ncbi:hypothetical protein PATSB16_36350 [Pandoraea thiooxydans]|uniref:Uncharacterized protein n=1 Tax=Pandoraea thiooxydans TaxID=445709 RepID=A0A0G3EQI6_9BURK|nr:hypothetical protein [Pandoraea thiooxydans]AKJ69348.1 hypothetical protein ABW99_15105 [Pandoraea thiooxydans]APR96971.1 hypothetical protein PATSB16_36350 [Pandoraea thiooxydans]
MNAHRLSLTIVLLCATSLSPLAHARPGQRGLLDGPDRASLREDIVRFNADRGQQAYPNWAAPADNRARSFGPPSMAEGSLMGRGRGRRD